MRRISYLAAWLVALVMLVVGADLALASGPRVANKPAHKTAVAHRAGPACVPLKVYAPNQLSDLRVTPANPCSTFLEARGDRALNGIALLTLRRNDNLLEATLEVGRFEPSAPVTDKGFQSSVFISIGDVVPRPLQVGNQTVYTSSSPGLQLVTWIRGRFLYVLAIRATYGFPKALVRDALLVRG
ncbi:MAG TPA: hypothetical protein VF137_10475 [Candidatus Dormibacteraeota bacterium]